MTNDETAKLAAEFFSDEVPTPRTPKRKRRQRDPTVRALELFVRTVEGAEPRAIAAAVRWLHAVYVEKS